MTRSSLPSSSPAMQLTSLLIALSLLSTCGAATHRAGTWLRAPVVATGCPRAFASPKLAIRAGMEIRVQRAMPGDATQATRLAALLIGAFYEPNTVLNGPFAWVQRQIIQADACSDLASRLVYYEAARRGERPNIGAVLVASSADGELCGFVDIGLPEYIEGRGFKLPRASAPPFAIDVRAAAREGRELRPYVSNLAVEPSARRCGVGRLLMEECEAEVRRWTPSQPAIWLEVSLTNFAAIAFYESLGYRMAGRSSGREIVKKQFGYEWMSVKRAMMVKDLT